MVSERKKRERALKAFRQSKQSAAIMKDVRKGITLKRRSKGIMRKRSSGKSQPSGRISRKGETWRGSKAPVRRRGISRKREGMPKGALIGAALTGYGVGQAAGWW